MSTVESLLAEIEAFCKEAGIAEATFATRAANDGKFVRRLREGRGVTVNTVDAVRAYIAEHQKPAKPRRARAAA